MKTIAEEAGVTLTTVSRILNNKGGKYAEATRQKIFDIADRLKYRPNALVHGMQSGRTNTAGVMIPLSGYFYDRIIAGIHDAFAENGIIMLLGYGSYITSEEDEARERQIIHQLIDRRVDGVILRPSCEAFQRSYFEEIWERDIPLIVVDREMSQVPTDFVGTDDVAGGRAATEYLVGLGHRRLLFVGSSELVSTSRHREEGYRNALSEMPNAYGHSLESDHPDFRESFIQLLGQDDRPTGIFCYSDPTAELTGAILLEQGLSIPGDVSIVGFGNQRTPDCPICFTTFDQHPTLIGQTAAELYLNRVDEGTGNGTRQERIKADMIVRDSTGPAPGAS